MLLLEINKFSKTPLYIQLKESIKQNIIIGKLKAGDKVPTEEEIGKTINVSRTVTKQAYSELVAEGYLVRYKGKGTFVKKIDARTGFFKEIISFNEEMKRSGFVPKTILLSNKRIPCSKYVAGRLGISEGDEVYNIRRVRYRDGESVYYCNAYYIAKHFNHLDKYDLAKLSLYETMQRYYQIKICKTIKSFSAVNADAKIAKVLGIEPGSPIQYVESIEYDQYNQIVGYDESSYVGERNTFEVEIIA